MPSSLIRIGTRGSKLALFQAEQAELNIRSHFPDVKTEIKIIATKGDKILDTALSKIGDKGLFTKEIEHALLENKIDIAVHSLKDLSTTLPAKLKLGAVLKRAEYRDVLVHRKNKKLQELSDKDIIATSSLRRKAALLHMNPWLNIVDIRGNINTRLKRMDEGYCDGMIMAGAGLIRLGLQDFVSEIIEPDTIIPAVGQGVIAIESRRNDGYVDIVVERLNHKETMQAVVAERIFLNTLQGGCQVPIGCYTVRTGTSLKIKGFVSSVDGKTYIEDSAEGPVAEAALLGKKLADRLLGLGAEGILKALRM